MVHVHARRHREELNSWIAAIRPQKLSVRIYGLPFLIAYINDINLKHIQNYERSLQLLRLIFALLQYMIEVCGEIKEGKTAEGPGAWLSLRLVRQLLRTPCSLESGIRELQTVEYEILHKRESGK